MTLPKFIVRGENTQKEQQKESAKMVPQSVKHTDLLRDRFLEPVVAPDETNPQGHEDESHIITSHDELKESKADERRERGSGGMNQ